MDPKGSDLFIEEHTKEPTEAAMDVDRTLGGGAPTSSLKAMARGTSWEKRRRRAAAAVAKHHGTSGGGVESVEVDPRNGGVGFDGGVWLERVSSVTEEDLDELKGCIELGFEFREEYGGHELSKTFPALDLYFAVNRPRDSLESWFSQSGDGPDDTKNKLREWAQAVACSVIYGDLHM